MAVTVINNSDPVSTWVSKTNTIASNLGDASLLTGTLVTNINNLDSDVGTRTSLGTTEKANLVAAINELETALRGAGSNYTLGTDATDIIAAINELETSLRGAGANYTLGTDAANVVSAINELETALRGTGSNYTLNTTASNLVAAINEHETDIGTVGSLNTTATNLVGAINELVSDLSDLDSDKSATLTTTINDLADLDSDVGTRTSLTTNNKLNLVAAINELNAEIDRNVNSASEIRSLFSHTDAGGDGSFSYNSSTGAFTYTGPSATEVRAHFSAGEGIDISSGSISGEDASTTNKGIASFNSTRFSVSSGAVDIASGGIDTTQIAGDAVDGTKIADNAINSEHYVDGSIDEVHLANDAVARSKLKDEVSLIIKNSSGTALKTLYGAGS